MSQDDSTPNGRGGGVDSWQDDSTPQTNGGGVESSWDDSTPREGGGANGDKTPGSSTASRSRKGGDGRGRGGGDKNPAPTQPTQEQPTDGSNGEAPRGAAAMGDVEAAARTETGAGGEEHLAAHPAGAASSTAAGVPVGGDRAIRGGENNGARYSLAHPTGAAPAAPAGGPVRERPAPSQGVAQRLEGWGETPRIENAAANTADEAMAERGPGSNGTAQRTESQRKGGDPP